MSLSNLSGANRLFSEFSELAIEFDRVVRPLTLIVERCGVETPENEDWYKLLFHKLASQIGDNASLIVSIMGGTNTGKSMIFNHLVGGHCSGVDYRASGTKHPVCVVSGSISNPLEILQRNFGNKFNFVEWSSSEQSLETADMWQFFWKVDENLTDRILVLDTPDIDSDSELNWARSREVRHPADVVIAVLTGQKYNDAAVRRFFREAAEASKPIIVIFNMVKFESDREHITVWLNQFCEETKSVPIAVLVVPFDESKASSLQLPFYRVEQSGNVTDEIVDLRQQITELHFERIKSQTIRGAINVITDETSGLPLFLRRIEFAAGQFEKALEAIEQAEEKIEIKWPAIPIKILAEEMQQWWHEKKRPRWARRINYLYDKAGRILVYPFIKLRNFIVGRIFRFNEKSEVSEDKLLQHFKESEENAVVIFIETVFNRLECLSKTDNLVLKKETASLLTGNKREEVLEQAKSVLEKLEPLETDFRAVFRKNLEVWPEKNIKKTKIGILLDKVLTIMRPLITAALIIGGWKLIGGVITELWIKLIVTVVIAVCGEVFIYSISQRLKFWLAGKLFKNVRKEFTLSRSKKFDKSFSNELWSEVINRLQVGASVVNSQEFQNCRSCLKKASEKIKDIATATTQ